MTVAKETRLGTISLSNEVFAQIIFDGMMQESCIDRIWPSTLRGRQVGVIDRFTDSEFALYITAERDADERIMLEFSVIVQFGLSIRNLTGILSDYIADRICELDGDKPSTITINIAGVRSRHKARRNTKVVYHYETVRCTNNTEGSRTEES